MQNRLSTSQAQHTLKRLDNTVHNILNEDIKKYDKQMVIDSMYTSMNSETDDGNIKQQSY